MRLFPTHLNTSPPKPRRRRIERFLLFLLLLLAPVAHAGVPAWRIDSSFAFIDVDEDGIADRTRFTYLVTNTSPPGDANNLISITFGTGSVCGVYEAAGPVGWLSDIQTDRTVFSGNGKLLKPNAPGVNFYLYSRYLGTAQGAAEAASLDDGPFPTLAVTLPAPRSASLAAPAAATGPGGTNRVTLAVASPDAPSFLVQYKDSLAATNWTNLRLCAVTGAVTVATDTNAAPARFYRAVIP